MGGAEGKTFGAGALSRKTPPPGSSGEALPESLEQLLPRDTARAWRALREVLPAGPYLIGGTAVAVHLGHRESRDLDFFSHRVMDLDALAKELEALPGFLLTHRSASTLKGLLGATKVEVFTEVNEENPQRALEEPCAFAGLRVASLRDLAAMKLKVIGDRGEMRDYFDLKLIEEKGGITVEDGLLLFFERYGVDPRGPALGHIVRALGYLDDVEEDEGLPITKDDLAAWWRKRQAVFVRNLDRRAKP
jgi:hypothetical protein